MLKKIALFFFGLLLLLIPAFLLGPRAKLEPSITQVQLPQNLEQYLKAKEAQFKDITLGAEKTIVWADSKSKAQTPFSIIYLHGFSATHQECAPLADLIAKKLGANLFYTRLQGHGRGSNPMGEAKANEWLNDTMEAYNIGKRIGKNVIILGTSTGATLALWLAAQKKTEQIKAMILMSPNFAPKDRRAEIILWPWGKQLLHLIAGENRSWRPSNKQQAKYWTTSYKSIAILEMMTLVQLVREQDLSLLKIPTQFIYSPKDQVISVELVKQKFKQLGSKQKQILAVNDNLGPSSHILAGKILAPKAVSERLKQIYTFLKPLLHQTKTDKK